MTDILLIEAPAGARALEKAEVPPLGLAYIAAWLERDGFKAEIFDLNLGWEGLERRMKKAAWIGVSCYTHNYHIAKKVLELAKRHGKKILIGGPHATSLYREALSDGFDYVVRGEGEHPVANLLKGSPDRRGLAFLEKGSPKANLVYRVQDLDSLPFPARHLLKLSSYYFPGAIATTRGCAHNCIFCSSRNQSGCLRGRSAENVRAELELLASMGMERFFVIDPNFAYSKERALRVCRAARDLGMEWFSELRLDHVDRELIVEMARSGCRVVRFGVESGSQRIVDRIRKGILLERLEPVLTAFVENHVLPVCGFMIGHPGETVEEFRQTVMLAKKVIALGGEATFSVLTPYPGTYVYRNAEKLGMRIKTRDWREYHHLNPVIETESFTQEQLRRMLFTALLELNGKSLPEIEIEEGEEPVIRRLMDGVERRSFRKLCMEMQSREKP